MKTILVVDDEYAIVDTLAELLAYEGYRVVSAANGKDGFVRLQKEKPDLVLVDYMMPIGDGREMVLEMRKVPEHQAIPVVMMSAATERAALSDGEGGELEVSAFLRKPFLLERLLATVEGLIGKGEKDAVRREDQTVH